MAQMKPANRGGRAAGVVRESPGPSRRTERSSDRQPRRRHVHQEQSSPAGTLHHITGNHGTNSQTGIGHSGLPADRAAQTPSRHVGADQRDGGSRNHGSADSLNAPQEHQSRGAGGQRAGPGADPIDGHTGDVDPFESDPVGKPAKRQQAAAQGQGVGCQDPLPPDNADPQLFRNQGKHSADSAHMRGEKHGALTDGEWQHAAAIVTLWLAGDEFDWHGRSEGLRGVVSQTQHKLGRAVLWRRIGRVDDYGMEVFHLYLNGKRGPLRFTVERLRTESRAIGKKISPKRPARTSSRRPTAG